MTGAVTLRVAQPKDAARIETFLAPYASTSMFLRSNLARHGISDSDAPHATQFALAEEAGIMRAVFGLTNSGYLMAQMPEDLPILSGLRQLWSGRTVRGMTGAAAQVGKVLAGMGLEDQALQMDRNEPLYDLNLATLTDPRIPLRAAAEQDREMLLAWFTGYLLDTGLHSDARLAEDEAKMRAERAAQDASLRIMEVDRVAVAMAALNAEAVDTVQVGGVFVPPGLRNRGYGRQVVAGLLAQARARGMTRAILFAASPQAARAYEGLGFQHIGEYRIVLFDTPTLIRTHHDLHPS